MLTDQYDASDIEGLIVIFHILQQSLHSRICEPLIIFKPQVPVRLNQLTIDWIMRDPLFHEELLSNVQRHT